MRTLSALLLCAASGFAGEGAMNPAERAYLLDVLGSTQKAMIASIQGLSDAQWRFKPAPEVWSVQECAEHIILSEDFIRESALKVAQTPAVARPATSTAEQDRKLFESIQDRSKKANAPEPIRPGAKFATPADAVKEFTARRAKTIEYVKTTNDELRTHVTPTPIGQADVYQFLLLLASHSARHTAQIKEVQANAAYPKSSK
jgi:hypothetical protein